MSEITALGGIIGMSALAMVVYMFLSARAITIWSAPRAGPKWATFFGYIEPIEGAVAVPVRSAVVHALFALGYQGAIAYIALHPEFLPRGGSFIFALEIVLAAVWTVYFFRLPTRSVTSGDVTRNSRPPTPESE